MKRANNTGYNKHTVSVVILIALVSVWLHLAILYLGDIFLPREPNHISSWWSGAWLMASMFALINTGDAKGDYEAIVSLEESDRALAPAAGWFLRIDALSLLGCAGMALGGYSSLFSLGANTTVGFLLLGGVFFIIQQAWNRADRLRIKRILREDRVERERNVEE